MKRVQATMVSLIALVFAAAVNAQQSNVSEVSWTYFEGGIANFKPDGRRDQTGLFGGGSIGLGVVPIHVFAEIGSLDEIDTLQLGAGWHGLLGPKADLFADLSYYDIDYDDGLRLRFGGRWMVLERLELNGYLSWTELDLNNRSIAFNGVYNITKRFGIGGGVDVGNKFTTTRLFARYNFGDLL
jgi:hypothetical protein